MPAQGTPWGHGSYSLLPNTSNTASSQSPAEMAIRDKLIAMKNRQHEQATRIYSRDNTSIDVETEEIVYRVYKRRWLGVGIIMLLNIISSWR
jgi:hypothetical protein